MLATANISSRDCAKAFERGDEATLSRAIAARIDGLPLIPTIKHLLAESFGDRRLAKVMLPFAAVTADEANVTHPRVSAAIFQSD